MPTSGKRRLIHLICGNDPPPVQRRVIAGGLLLARNYAANISILIPNVSNWPPASLFLASGIPDSQKVEVISLEGGDSYSEKIERKISLDRPDLILVGREPVKRAKLFNDLHWWPDLLSKLETPVLVLNHKLGPPFSSLLVPMSGEHRYSPALAWALEFANELSLPLDILHVMGEDESRGVEFSLTGSTCDQMHHEYPGLIDEWIAQASPYSPPSKKGAVRKVSCCMGEVLEQLLKRLPRKGHVLVVAEWKGHLEEGHAHVLKGILLRTHLPILLMKEHQLGKSKLKIGWQFKR